MKWLYLSLGVAVAAAVIAGGISVFRRRISVQNDDDIDGGVVKRYWSDAPKVIASNEITEFHSVLSLISAYHADEVGHRVYRLDAVIENNAVLVRYDWYDRQGDSDRAEYKTDVDF